MVREEAEREEDSGWSFMAGNEDDEFIEDYKNIKLLSIAEMCQMAPEIQEPGRNSTYKDYTFDELRKLQVKKG